MVKVSVIIPVYNEEDYLCECLDSICRQSLKDIEIICVDDGSTDNSAEILEQYRVRDSRIKVLHQKNQYAGVARNKGMEHAVGKYLSFLDSDDFFEIQYLERMYEEAEKNTSDIVICRASYFDNIRKVKEPRNIPNELNYLPSNINSFNSRDIPEHIFQITNGWAWDKLFRTDFIKREGLLFQDGRTANDGFFVYMALAKAKVITKINEFLVNQRINNETSLSNTRESSWYCGFQMLYDIKQGLMQNQLYNIVERSFINFSLGYILWSFDSINAWESKKKIYNVIRTEAAEKLKLIGIQEDYFYDRGCRYKFNYIYTHSYEEYVADFVKGNLILRLKSIALQSEEKVWPFPFHLVPKGSCIVLYGAGQMGQDYFKQAEDSQYCQICLWMDKRFKEKEKDNKLCGWVKELKECKYEKVLIALRNKETVYNVRTFLMEQGVPEEKIVF